MARAGVGLYRTGSFWARAVLAAGVMESAFWAAVLPDRSADFFPPLRTLLLVGGLLVGLMLLFADPLPRRTVGIAGLAGLAVILAGPAAHLLQTTTTAHSGAIVSAGPTIAGGGFEPGGGQFLGGGSASAVPPVELAAGCSSVARRRLRW